MLDQKSNFFLTNSCTNMQKRELFINSKLVVGLFFQNLSEIVNQNNPNTKKDVLQSVNDIHTHELSFPSFGKKSDLLK